MKTVVHMGLALTLVAGTVHADSVALVASDISGFVQIAQQGLLNTGKFSAVDIFDARSGTPLLSDIEGYDDILAWTDFYPADPVAFGNLLADFYDKGSKHVTIATYALTNPGGIAGRISTVPYSALVDSTNRATPSGTLAPIVPNDVVFAGVNLNTLTYYRDSGFANANLAANAALLANDGAGVNMIARSQNGVVNVNFYPGATGSGTNVNNSDLFLLLANTFATPPVPCITGLTATATTNGKIQLAWPLAGSDHYNVYRAMVSGGPYAPIGSTNSATGTYLDNSVVSGTYYYVVREANASNIETCQSNEAHAVVIGDTIPPTTTITSSPAPKQSGWNNSNVTITLTATDNAGGSGVQQISIALSGAQTGSTMVPGGSATVSITAEGITVITYFSTDNAGNVEAAKTVQVMLDKTPPTVTSSVNPLPNASGWNDTDVTVSFAGSDSLSGVASCTAPVTFTKTGAGQVAKGQCADNAGNMSAAVSATVNIDKALPVIGGVPTSCVVWAPDHKLVQVATLWIQGYTTSSFDVTATSNEPADPGQSDIVITGTGLQPRVVALRAERSGENSDRIYTVTAKASNWAGDSMVKTFSCVVPHDQGGDAAHDSH